MLPAAITDLPLSVANNVVLADCGTPEKTEPPPTVNEPAEAAPLIVADAPVTVPAVVNAPTVAVPVTVRAPSVPTEVNEELTTLAASVVPVNELALTAPPGVIGVPLTARAVALIEPGMPNPPVAPLATNAPSPFP